MRRGWYLPLLTVPLLAATIPAGAPDKDRFEQSIGPIFATRCLNCHNDQQREGSLSLVSGESMRAGGDSGQAVRPGDPEASLLLQRVSAPEPDMPEGGPPLTKEEVDAIRKWIAGGATWPEHVVLESAPVSSANWWSLKPLEQPKPPRLDAHDAHWKRTTIDAFVIAKLREMGLGPSAPAGRPTLIRRLYFDLIGLPPTPVEIDEFVSDSNPQAYERLVDRLLSSPHYGERWARHWMDVVHYGDTHGYDKDKPRPNAWPYRDYVIRSFNSDKPYSRFVREQIAGDVLRPFEADAIVATGFIAAGPWDFIGHAEVPESKIDGKVARNLDRDDMVSSTMNTFASMTVQCARCHDHKFDPVTQEQYYGLQAVFAALDRADRTYDEDPEIAQRRAELEAKRKRLDERNQKLQAQVNKFGGKELAAIDNKITEVASEKSDEVQQQLAKLKQQRQQLLSRVLDEATKLQLATVTASLDSVAEQLAKLPAPSMVYAGTVHHGSGTFLGTGHTGGKPREIYVLARGDVNYPGPLVRPGAVAVFGGADWHFDLPTDHCEGDRRVALGDWIAHVNNPLSWRSIVNRVWHYHFGRGLVETPNDFGRMGATPTHPELLDWLAVQFRDRGQSLKDLHRLIVTSGVYRQSSATDAARARIDADNKYLWRMTRRALDAESIRDSVLAVSGKLDRKMFGPAFMDFVIEKPEHSPHYEYHKYDPEDATTHRRSVYRFLVRSQQQPFMQTLDCADPSQSVARRDTTLTATQALALLNNRFMVRMSEHFARRVSAECPQTSSAIDSAFRLAVGRAPNAEEKAALGTYAEQFGFENACRVVLNLNEFVFVD